MFRYAFPLSIPATSVLKAPLTVPPETVMNAGL